LLLTLPGDQPIRDQVLERYVETSLHGMSVPTAEAADR
jgi:hypothetical protein